MQEAPAAEAARFPLLATCPSAVAMDRRRQGDAEEDVDDVIRRMLANVVNVCTAEFQIERYDQISHECRPKITCLHSPGRKVLAVTSMGLALWLTRYLSGGQSRFPTISEHPVKFKVSVLWYVSCCAVFFTKN
jgi:hypothetical protein